MATQVQFRGGSSTEHNSFTGAAREVTVDTTKNTVVIHDGSTAGGHPLAKENNPTFTGNVRIGTTTEGTALADNLTVEDSGHSGITIRSGTSSIGSLYFSDATSGAAEYAGFVEYNHNGNYLGFGTGSTSRLRVDSSGRLLVGTTTEGAVNADNLTINDSGDAGITIRSGSTNAGSLFFSDSTTGAAEYAGYLQYDQSSNYLAIGTNSAERLRIDSSGNVGIGVTPPDYGSGRVSLDLHSSGATVTHLALTNSTTGSNGASNGFNIIQNGLNTLMYLRESGFMSFSTANTERMRIDSSGNVGIGTTSPSGLLHISGNTCQMHFTDEDDASSSRIYQSGATFAIDVDQANAKAGSVFAIRSDDQERLRIDSSGKVGIGVAAPLVKLDVVDSAAMSAIFRQSSGNQTSVYIEHDDSSGRIGTSYAAGGGAYKPLAFETSNTERMRIDSSGNVGIGLSNPGDYYPQSNNLVVGTTSGNRGISVVSATTGTGSLVFADGTGNFENRRGQIVYDHSTDSLELFTDQIERMRIDSSGNVGIGTASPTTKLHVNGSATFANSGDGVYTFLANKPAANAFCVSGGSNSSASSPNFYIHVTGAASFNGAVTAQGTVLTSDQRFKENITDANSQLADVTALGNKLRNWNWTADAPVADKDTRFLGLVAQEAETICPGIVTTIARTKDGAELTPETTDEEGNVTPATYEELDDSYKGIKNDVLIMKLLGAVAELSAKVETLEQRLSDAGIA